MAQFCVLVYTIKTVQRSFRYKSIKFLTCEISVENCPVSYSMLVHIVSGMQIIKCMC